MSFSVELVKISLFFLLNPKDVYVFNGEPRPVPLKRLGLTGAICFWSVVLFVLIDFVKSSRVFYMISDGLIPEI